MGIMFVLAVLFPLVGASLIAVWLLDRLVSRFCGVLSAVRAVDEQDLVDNRLE